MPPSPHPANAAAIISHVAPVVLSVATASSPSLSRTPRASAKDYAYSTDMTPSASPASAARVASSLARLAPLFPGDLATGILNEDYEDSLLFADESEDSIGDNEPCPVLDPTTGTCDLYEHRPIVCRTFGPPMRTPEGDLATCELCYITATTEEIAACELDPTIPSQEAASNEAFNAAHVVCGETIVACALQDSKDPQ